MQEQETRILTAGPEKTGVLCMIPTILKTAVAKEDTAVIEGRWANGGRAVSGSATGIAYVRIPINSSFLKIINPDSNLENRGFFVSIRFSIHEP